VSTITLIESSAFTGHGFRLDKTAGIAYGVAICGRVSANNRDYPDDVRDRDKAIYEGANCFIDHAAGSERKVREWFGALQSTRTRVSDRKTVGDLHYAKNSGFAAEFEERAERFPGSFGLSHVAECETKRINGRESITAIRKVHSVDLVVRPATNSSLFESVGSPPTLPPIPSDGAGFARWLKGEVSPEELKAFLESIRGPRSVPTDGKKFAEVIRNPSPVSTIPNTGKAFAEWLRGR